MMYLSLEEGQLFAKRGAETWHWHSDIDTSSHMHMQERGENGQRSGIKRLDVPVESVESGSEVLG